MKSEKQIHCNNPSCGKELIHTEGRRPKKYCSVGCRNAHYKEVYKKTEKVILIPDENGKWMTADGKKVSIVWDDKDDRDNPLINAARGRDESGINEDEIRHEKTPTPDKKPFMSDAIKKKLGL